MGIIIDEDLSKLLADMANLLSIANSLRSLVGNPNDSPNLGSLNGKLNKIIGQLSEIQSTQTAQNATLGDIEGNLITILADVIALGSPQQAGSPVTLPSTPPYGYGGASAWAVNIGPSGETAAEIVNYAGSWAWQSFVQQSSGFPFLYFSQINANMPMTQLWSASYPVFGWNLILPGEDALTCLTRLNPLAVCSWFDGVNGHVQVFMPATAQQNQWVSTFDGAQFDRMSFFLYTPSSGPPERSTLGDTNLLLSLIPLQYG